MNKKRIFWTKCLENPRSMGAIAPSSPSLAKAMAKYTHYTEGQIVVELGAGTGALTKGLIEAGVQNLWPIEIDMFMVHCLQERFPHLTILQGDASRLHDVLPAHLIGQVDTIVSSLPLINFDKAQKEAIIQSCFSVLKPEGRLLQYTYGWMSPIAHKTLHLKAKRLKYVMLNIPPAFIWEFRKV